MKICVMQLKSTYKSIPLDLLLNKWKINAFESLEVFFFLKKSKDNPKNIKFLKNIKITIKTVEIYRREKQKRELTKLEIHYFKTV